MGILTADEINAIIDARLRQMEIDDINNKIYVALQECMKTGEDHAAALEKLKVK
jgi:hypothetical protein